MTLKLNGTPFNQLKVVYFIIFDKPGERNFIDTSDEDILKIICKEYGETAYITKIEDVEVLEVITRIPIKQKLDVDELKSGSTLEERREVERKVKEIKNKYENKNGQNKNN